MVHGSLKLTCGKNVEEFKSASQTSLGMLSIELNRFYCMEKQMSLDMQTVKTHEVLREKKI